MIVLKTKKPAPPKPTKPSTGPPPTTTITTSALSLTAESTINKDVVKESMSVVVSTQGTKKRKAPDAFKFKAQKLSISLHAPVETMQKKNGVKTTIVLTKKMTKYVFYNLDDYIFNMSFQSTAGCGNDNRDNTGRSQWDF